MRSPAHVVITQINSDKRFVVAQGGITLHHLHAGLATRGLCMMNCGSISDQTLAGVVSTATHGSGVKYGVLSTHVQAITLLLADGSTVRCSPSDHVDLFSASLCGLGSTGLILSVQMEVEPTFRLKEHQQTLSFGDTLRRMPELIHSAEHVRLWWFPQADSVRVSAANRTLEVCTFVYRRLTGLTPMSSQLIDTAAGFGIRSSDSTLYSLRSFLGDILDLSTSGPRASLPGSCAMRLPTLTRAIASTISTAKYVSFYCKAEPR